MPRVLAKRLTAQQASRLFERFYNAYGPDIMRDAYWWESARDAAIGPGEHAWSFHAYIVHAPEPNPKAEGEQPTMVVRTTRELIGWGTCQLQLDVADDNEAVLAAGVFPEHQRQGYRNAILDWMCNWAKRQGAEYAVTNTNNSNEAQIKRKMRESKNGSPWLYAGERFIPAPGYTIFVRDLTPGEETETT